MNTALGNYDAANGDIFKSQYAFAVYDDILGWIGNLDFMLPGEGYMFRTTNPQADLIFPENGMSSIARKVTRPARLQSVTPWIVNDQDYPLNMSVLAEIPGTADENIIVGAFVGGECRGIAEGKTYEIGGVDKVLYFLTIHGEGVDEISFKGYDKTNNETFSFTEALTFISNGSEGTVSDPYPIGDGVLFIGDINSNDSYYVYPNPFMDFVKVQFVDDVNTVHYEVRDAVGAAVEEGRVELGDNTFTWKPSNLNAGVYTITFDMGNETKTLKVVKL